MKKLKVYIADDHPLIIEGMRAILIANNFKVIGYSQTGEDVIDWFKTNGADILVLDLSLPIKDGFEVLYFLKQTTNKVKTLILSNHNKFAFIQEALNLGAKGFVSKDLGDSSIADAIYQISNGRWYFSKDVKQTLSSNDFSLQSIQNPEETFEKLSNREQQTLSLLVDEFSYNEIADDLNQSASSIRTYISRIKEKTNIKTTRGLAVRFAFLKMK